ncbi:MAG: hypothetical protein JWR19_4414 [Pedosphaera sp.]|nr:hypothetical protein [Pedosphaera sp.]
MKTLPACWLVLTVLASACFGTMKSSAAITLQTGQNFTAATLFIDAGLVPPDSDGAIGPNHFVEFINGRFSVFDKNSGTRVQTMTDISFWNSAGVSFPAGAFTSDPRVIYDPLSARWFASQIDVMAGNEISNRFLLAVSTNSDPTGAWNGVAWPADPAGSFADYPRLGVDVNGVYLTGNQFDAIGNFAGVLITSIPKSDLLLPTPTVTNRTSSGLMPESQRGFVLQPAVNFNPANTPEFVLAVDSDGTDFLPHTNLRTFKITGADTPTATLSANTDIVVPDYSVPINPPQPNGMNTLDDGDLRIGAYAFQVADVVYAVHAVEVGPRAALRWYRLRASDSTLLESGTISDTNLDLFYPSIAANTNGFVVIGFNGSSTNSFISSYAVAGRTINSNTIFADKVLLKAGADNYELAPSGGGNRWGDYSTTTVDAANPDHFWTIQEFPSSVNVWSTQVTEMIVAEPLPVLQITGSGPAVALSWLTNNIGFALQSSPSVAPGAVWSPVTNTVVTVGNQFSVTVDINPAAQFFRLFR